MGSATGFLCARTEPDYINFFFVFDLQTYHFHFAQMNESMFFITRSNVLGLFFLIWRSYFREETTHAQTQHPLDIFDGNQTSLYMSIQA